MDSLGRTEGLCNGIQTCENCPFKAFDGCVGVEMDDPEKAIDIVMGYELPVDWSKVPVDTPIYVRDSTYDCWTPRYFARFVDGIVFTWVDGKTSFTTDIVASWAYAKLKTPLE